MKKIGKKKRVQKKTLNGYAQCGAGCVAHCVCNNDYTNATTTQNNYNSLKN